ncbi:MAG: glycosyltransferase family 2 protein [archaeon]
MVEVLTYVYLVYMFVGLYMMSFFLMIYFKNRKTLFDYPKHKKEYKLSVVIAAYNEEKTIETTIEHVFASTYPLFEVIVVNDGSKDGTKEIIQKLIGKYPGLKLLDNKKNIGKANSLNKALKIISGELMAVTDADSYPLSDSMDKMVGFFNDSKVGAVTNSILVKSPKRFIEILQAFEYTVIAWTRKMLDYVDSVYVTNGPLSIYRTSALREVGGFDPKNLTEDIEVTWHLVHEGYKARMCLPARTYTTAPVSLRRWIRQRTRWNMGGLQTLNKYKSSVFRKNMLGYFILPFFTVSWLLGLVGISIFSYLFLKRFLTAYLSTSYSIYAQTAILTLQDINLTPSILIYFGVMLFFLGLFFTLFALRIMKEDQLKRENYFNLLFYTVVYLTVFPIILVYSIYKLARGKLEW